MSYSSTGGKPFERASKSSHHHIINDPLVKSVLDNLEFPPKETAFDYDANTINVEAPEYSNIKHIIAIDGGFTETYVREGFPSSAIHFFQLGALYFKYDDLKNLDVVQHIAPEDMAKLNNISRLKLCIPSKGVRTRGTSSLSETVRISVKEFLNNETLGEKSSLMSTLKWFVFRQYKNPRTDEEKTCQLMSSSPVDDSSGSIKFQENDVRDDGLITSLSSNEEVYLSDIFRFHEIIDEESGAASISPYLLNAMEHLILLHIIKHIIQSDPLSLKHVLFIMDRPTGWFGQVARLHQPMLELVNWLFDHHDFYLAGIEKSGAFVDHANYIQEKLAASSALLLDDKYIYTFISPSKEETDRPYGITSYYGHKVIFKSSANRMYVVSIPVRALSKEPSASDLKNLNEILTLVDGLKCDMYESSLLPVVLVNKLVSLSSHPSSQILRQFAKNSISDR